MDLSWGGHTNGLIPLNAMRYVASVGQYFEPDMADRVDTLVRLAATQGLTVRCQEGYRPLGSEPDQYITNEAKTSTGGSNQWFQWGRYQRGETPSAGKPGTGSHGWGRAGDWTPGRENPIMLDLCTKLGLGFIIGSESWHAQVVATPSITYKGPDPLQILHDLQEKEEDEMRIIQVAGVRYLLGNQYVAKFAPNPFNDGKPENTTNGILTGIYENEGATKRAVWSTASPVKGETAALMHGVPTDAFRKIAASTSPLAWSIQRGFFDPTAQIGK